MFVWCREVIWTVCIMEVWCLSSRGVNLQGGQKEHSQEEIQTPYLGVWFIGSGGNPSSDWLARMCPLKRCWGWIKGVGRVKKTADRGQDGSTHRWAPPLPSLWGNLPKENLSGVALRKPTDLGILVVWNRVASSLFFSSTLNTRSWRRS